MVRRRLIRPKGAAPSPDRAPKSDTTISIERSHARQILDMPVKQRDRVIRYIREGIPTGKIAQHFADGGLITVSAKSFAQYITAFKRLHGDLIEDYQAPHVTLDQFFEGAQPELDEEATLEQLLRLQKGRLGIAHQFERNTNLLNPNLHREVDATTRVVEALAKLRGKTVGAGRPEKDGLALPADAKDKIASMDRSSEAQNKLIGLFGRLAEQVGKRDSNDPQIKEG